MKTVKKDRTFIVCTTIFVLYAIVGLGSNQNVAAIVSRIVIMTLFALSFNLQFGYAGMAGLGHSIFFGLGGYGLVVCMSKFHIGLLPALPLTFIFCCVAALLVGVVCLKNNMLTFTFLSMGITLAVATAFGKWVWVGGMVGITYGVAPAWMADYRILFLFIWVVAAIGCLLLYLLTRAPFISMLQGSRENEERLVFLGVNTNRLRLTTFVISGAFASVAGMLYAFRNSGAYISSIDVGLSFQAVIMCVLGGMTEFVGPFIGAFLVTVVYNYLSVVTPYYEGILGVVILLVVYFMREGLISRNGPVLRFINRMISKRKTDSLPEDGDR